MRFDNLFYSDDPPLFEREAWLGLMFRWYGVDKNGHLAAFESGELPIPKLVFRDENVYRELDLFFRELETITVGTFMEGVPQGNRELNEMWLNEAGKGLNCFDDIDTINSRTVYGYYLIAVPGSKLTLSDLPERIQDLIRPITFPIAFGERNELEPRDFFAC